MYSHRQHGHVIKWAATIVAGISALIIYILAPHLSSVALAAVSLAIALSFVFGRMTMEVNDRQLSWWFGPGVWKKTVPFAEITSAEAVRNNWWWGWGIRYYGKGWLYNVSGLDAVEITVAPAAGEPFSFRPILNPAR